MTPFGPYQLIRRLGAGATAEVFLARGPSGGRSGSELLALKLILPHLAEDGGTRALLLREARAVARLRHPNVVEIYDVGEIDGRTFLAMEYVPGFPLNAVVRVLREREQRMTIGEAAYVVRAAALGLHHAHEAKGADGNALGLIHRDVSPHNLMVAMDGRVKVVDFGLARATHANATQTGGLKGKLRYMPPEQLRSEALDRRVDVFALGAILWELALGAPLYPGPTEADIFQQALFEPLPHPDEIVRGLPRAFVELLERAVARDPARRFATAAELAVALEPFAGPRAQKMLMQRQNAVLGRVPRTLAEAEALAVPIELGRAQTGSVPTLSESIAPPQIGARAPLPPPAPVHTPQEARMAPALVPLPRVARKRAAPDVPASVGYTPGAEITQPGEAPRHPSRLRAATSTLVRRWRRREWMKWSAVAALALLSAGGFVVLLAARKERPGESAVRPAGVGEDWREEPGQQTGATGSEDDSRVSEAATAVPGAGVVVEQRSGQELERPARRGSGTLVLTSDRPALVTQGTRELGMTPLTLELAAGRHQLRLRSLDGQRAASVEVTLSRDAVVKRQVLLEPL